MKRHLALLRARLRPPLARVLWPVLRPFRRRLEVGRSGTALAPGITAVVSARDEAYTIRLSLRSLVGVADQIVCIDNGSQDNTLAEIEAFRREFGGRIEVDVLSMPGALLGECREAGLRLTRHQWHLRWDADLVAKTSGPESMAALRERVLRDDRPRTLQLPRTNLYGDLKHALAQLPILDPGEPILVRFGRGIEYREFGRFDAIRVPLHYQQTRESGRHYFHLSGLKSDVNLIHRFHYFTWRELVNRPGGSLDPQLQDLESYKRARNLELFGTNEPCALKYRFRKQLSYLFTPYLPEKFGEYPALLQEELARPQRFEIVVKDGRRWRIDHEDREMLDYRPTEEDLQWDAERFLRRFLDREQCLALGIPPA
jgi:glycosyltransferase involved in cell wall biosynthesis